MREVLLDEVITCGDGRTVAVVMTVVDSLSMNVVENPLKLRTRNASFLRIVVCSRDLKRMLESQSRFELKDLIFLYCQERNGGEIPF